MLEDLFQACDDDGSGALSLHEFAQLCEEVDETTREMFDKVDIDVTHGKLTQEEFVAYHLRMFSALDDDVFNEVVTQLMAKAEDVDIIDDEVALVPILFDEAHDDPTSEVVDGGVHVGDDSVVQAHDDPTSEVVDGGVHVGDDSVVQPR